MPRSETFRRPRVAALFVVAACVMATACRGARDAAAQERATQEQEVRRLAERAGEMAAENSAGRDTGPHVTIGSDGGDRIARGDDPPLGPGDVRVTSTDGALILAVIGDSVRMRFGDSVVTKVQREMAAKTDTAGVGGFVARTVAGALTGAMSAATRFALRVPAAEVHDMTYAGGELSFRTGRNNRTRARFPAADAERFMAAVRARQQRPAAR